MPCADTHPVPLPLKQILTVPAVPQVRVVLLDAQQPELCGADAAERQGHRADHDADRRPDFRPTRLLWCVDAL